MPAPAAPPLLDLALWLAALAQLCVLGAGVQVPRRLNWRDELARLSRFNRRLMWVYYGFIGLTIVGFSASTFAFRERMLAGEPVALALAGFIAAWWTARIAVDALVFDHADWPPGALLRAGHVLLTSTFVAIAATYVALLAWHLAR